MRKRPLLKTRTFALVLLIVSIVLAGYSGWHLKQALDVEHELRAQMSDLSLATMSDANAPLAVVSLGEKSLMHELNEVRATAHHDELLLALEAVGLLAGVLLLRRQPTLL